MTRRNLMAALALAAVLFACSANPAVPDDSIAPGPADVGEPTAPDTSVAG